MTAPRLSTATLEQLPPRVRRPAYRRERHGVGVVHIGPGAFHRAHQAEYFEDVLEAEGGDWRILDVALRSDRAAAQLSPQDGLYTLMERDGSEDRLRVVGAVSRVVAASSALSEATAAVASPDTHLVTLTVTEKAYVPPAATDGSNGAGGAVSFLTAALERRRRGCGAPLTLLSCDNLVENGDRLKVLLTAHAQRTNPSLAAWVADRVACPNTMVDRITPASRPEDLDALEGELGIRDEAMVRTEPFRQWVVEDRFAAPRPDLAAVGVQLVADVRPFEAAKLRMLNGAHSILAYLGLLAGHAFVHQAVEDRAIAPLIGRYFEEAAATVPPAPGLDLKAYAADLLARFKNPRLQHALVQIAQDGSQKLPQRLGPVIAARSEHGADCDVSVLGVAAWVAWLRRNRGQVTDPRAAELACAVGGGGAADGLARRVLSLPNLFPDSVRVVLAERVAGKVDLALHVGAARGA